MNIASNLDSAAYHFPDRRAVVEGNRSVAFLEFNRDIARAASALIKVGLRPGDRAALCAPNSYDWLVFYFGVIKTGAAAATFSHLSAPDELGVIMDNCRPKILFVGDKKADDFKKLRRRLYPELVVGDHGDLSLETLIEKGNPDFKTVDRHRSDTAAILYTGGTTGVPKGAELSHENLQTSIFNVARYERSAQDDLALCFLPLNHVFAQIHIMNSAFFSGGGIVVQPGFDLEKTLEAIERRRVTKLYAVPTIYIRLLRLPDLRQKIKPIRYCFSAAASMSIETVIEWKRRTGLNIHEAYGMTESASMVTYNHYYKHTVGSVGAPANLVEVQIRDLEGKILPPGQQGEICVCGPNITKGYLNNPEETKAAFWGEWFRSGDIGTMDENGYLYIADRLKDMIITGGENVYPREVEEILHTRDEVLECAVVGLPDPEYGERTIAFIVPEKDRLIDAGAIKNYLKSRLSAFKVPKEYVVVDELPKNNAGKLLKREIKKQYGDGANIIPGLSPNPYRAQSGKTVGSTSKTALPKK